MKKNFKLPPDQIKPLATGRGACIATDMILVQGRKVGYFYRDEPQDQQDSGWIFTSGHEAPEYMDDAGNHGVYDVNTLANYDPEIIPFLNAPPGCSFEREGGTGPFVQVHGEPYAPSESAASAKNWPPGFPLVKGHHALNATWSIQLPERFARRIEKGSLVLWRPGLTLWITAWNNDHDEPQARRLAGLKQAMSPERFAERETKDAHVTRYQHRLRDESEDGPVEALYGFILCDTGHLQVAIYFDDVGEEQLARRLVESVTARSS